MEFGYVRVYCTLACLLGSVEYNHKFIVLSELLVLPCIRYNIEQEQKLATETTVLVESYTVSAETLM